MRKAGSATRYPAITISRHTWMPGSRRPQSPATRKARHTLALCQPSHRRLAEGAALNNQTAEEWVRLRFAGKPSWHKVMIMRLLRRLGLLLFVGALVFQTIRKAFFPPLTPEIATEVTAPGSDTQLEEFSSEGPLSQARSRETRLSPGRLLDQQRQREAPAKVSSQSTSQKPANTDLTEREKLQLKQQPLLDDQAQQEAAAYEESLQSTNRPQANTNPTEQEKLQLEQQRLLDDQAQQEAAAYEESLQSTNGPQATNDLTEEENLQLEQQRLLDDQAQQEAAAYEESLRSANTSKMP